MVAGGGPGKRTARAVAAVGVGALVLAALPFGHTAATADPVTLEDLEPVTTDDPLASVQWYLDETRVREAWNLTRGVPEVTVAVIDTGTDPVHRDLAGAFWRDPASDRRGRDLLNGASDPYDQPSTDWHGTAVAGVLGARADDDYGMAGVAPEVSVLSMKIYDSAGLDEPPQLEGGYSSAIEAIRAATELGADVLLLAWGGQDPSDRLRDAIAEAGVPVVVAAGNDGQDLSNDPDIPRYPAMEQLPNLVTVTASNLEGDVWTDSAGGGANIGVRHVDIAAPGELIVGPTAGAEHRDHSGTSFAAPQVAGALALALSLAPSADAAELVGALNRTARPTDGLDDAVTSGGILDV
ncbi:MAG: S8 family serine peptidase, partial [Nitriliruptoraceae bacterium]